MFSALLLLLLCKRCWCCSCFLVHIEGVFYCCRCYLQTVVVLHLLSSSQVLSQFAAAFARGV